MKISYINHLDGVDWGEIKQKVKEDNFDNGRTVEQLRISFENSYATCIAYAGEQIAGKVRALSDGVCNAYVVDVWIYHPYRGQGIAREMMVSILEQLPGQHVYLFSDDAIGLYEKLGFKKWGTGLGKVVGVWLEGGE